MGRRLAFLFVCQQGDLEIEGLLLAASLRRHLEPGHELVACVPEPEARWGRLGDATRALLAKWGVRAAPVRNEVADDYPIGNKVSCLRVPCDAEKLVLVDSDVLCVAPFGDDPRFARPFLAKPADAPSFEGGRPWVRAYGAFGLDPPETRVRATVTGELMLPYFNAGFVVVDRAAGLGDAWLDACRRIDAKWGIPDKRPHLDQIALPVAVAKLGLDWEALDDRWNFPANKRPVPVPGAPGWPWLVHYHRAAVVRREPVLADLVRSLCREEPALDAIVRAHDGWAPVLRDAPRATPASAPGHDLLVSGIPRSGTSWLCNLLHRHANAVVLNEPDAVGIPLRKEATPWGVGTFLRDVRRDVREGRAIRNKLKDGQVTEDTVHANDATEYLPAVETEDFVLGAKNTLGFLSRLADLRRALPHARVVLCVRNPFDTVASWKDSFDHLAAADVASQRHAGLRQRFLDVRLRRDLEQVAAIRSAAVRRAAWWRFLAERVLEAGPGVEVVRYADLAARPAEVVARIVGGWPAGALRAPIEPSKPRTAKRSGLDAEDVRAVRALCRETADALGVWEDLS